MERDKTQEIIDISWRNICDLECTIEEDMTPSSGNQVISKWILKMLFKHFKESFERIYTLAVEKQKEE